MILNPSGDSDCLDKWIPCSQSNMHDNNTNRQIYIAIFIDHTISIIENIEALIIFNVIHHDAQHNYTPS